jgi:flagellar protein FlgJ
MAALDSAAGNAAAGFAADSRALDALRAQAKGDPDKALKQAAGQFEALFMQMLLKSMRDAVPQFSPLENDASRMYTGMLDQQLSQNLSTKGLGLADMMIKQLAPKKLSSTAEKSASVEKINRASSEVLDAGKTPQEFVDRMLPHALEAGKATGVPARFILGQAALESGWGKGEIRAADGAASHNLFGIKAGAGWKGRSVAVTTTEYVDGKPRKQVEKFRAYDNYAEGFRDYARLIANNPRYAAAVKPNNDAAGFAQGLAKGGYATDPAYAAKLTRVINSTLLAQRGAA